MLNILPQTNLPLQPPRKDRPMRAMVLHGGRVLVFAAIILLISLQARQRYQQQLAAESELNLPLDVVFEFFPKAVAWGAFDPEANSRMVLDQNQHPLGYVMQTSPETDNIIGFSGPTNLLLLFDTNHELQGIKVLWSRDTKEHLRQVQADPQFLKSFEGINREHVEELSAVDAVSGATLTSLAIVQSVVQRLGGDVPSLKFPQPLTVDEVQTFFDEASRIKQDLQEPALWHVFDQSGTELGTVLRTSPAADSVVGYQGPTEALVALDSDGKVFRIWVRKSYDNEPYYGYLNQDWAFRDLYTGLTLPEVATYDLVANEVEGVSGATMTSMAVAQGAIEAAKAHCEEANAKPQQAPVRTLNLTARDLGTITVILTGIVIALTRWRGNARVRVLYQLTLMIYVGFINGDLLSQAMLVGWAQNGIPWKSALSLVLITGVAVIFPVLTKRNVYCSHLCPHGAIQQLLKNRVRKPINLDLKTKRILGLIPGCLLIWVVLVAMLNLSASLVDIEPFDAYLFQIAGGATMTIFVVGLVVSLFLPMGYCKYGCPTGNLLEYLRRHRRSDQVTWKDGFAFTLLLLALLLYFSK